MGALGGAGEAGGAGNPEELQKALEELTKLLQMMMEILKTMGLASPDAKAPGAPAVGGAGGAGGAGAAPQAARAAGGGGGGGGGGMDGFSPAGGAGGAAAAGQSTPTGPAVNIQGIKVDPSLAPAIEQIANHPDGAKLLEAAKAQGLTEITVNSNLNPDGGAGVEGLFDPNSKSIQIANPNGDSLIHILAHELGHAATANDGNSQLEERTVDALGEKIHQDITGVNSPFTLDIGAYSDLAAENGVLNSLRAAGIRV
jgi:hypothetical protein